MITDWELKLVRDTTRIQAAFDLLNGLSISYEDVPPEEFTSIRNDLNDVLHRLAKIVYSNVLDPDLDDL